jgi:outer membrane protein insertion porin family/translocation and assembly module TamA
LGGVLFADASDVSRELKLSFLAPHLSPGFGLRYRTPIGPVRFDMGYRLPFAQDVEGRDDDAAPAPLFGLPLAIHLTLGEAF